MEKNPNLQERTEPEPGFCQEPKRPKVKNLQQPELNRTVVPNPTP